MGLCRISIINSRSPSKAQDYTILVLMDPKRKRLFSRTATSASSRSSSVSASAGRSADGSAVAGISLELGPREGAQQGMITTLHTWTWTPKSSTRAALCLWCLQRTSARSDDLEGHRRFVAKCNVRPLKEARDTLRANIPRQMLKVGRIHRLSAPRVSIICVVRDIGP